MIAGFYIGDVGADLLDHAGGFVAEHGGQRMRIQAFHEMQVGVAQPGDASADQHLARPGFRQADILDHQRLVDFMQDGGLHCGFLVLLFSSSFRSAPAKPESRTTTQFWIPASSQARPGMTTLPYAAKSNSPTSAMPTARSPSRWPAMARCVAFSVSRNGSPTATR